uniref:Inner membrane protein n=1 Tax=Steinernema glaseri TaxID=37863 RepID=A0A1I7YA48_9BILA
MDIFFDCLANSIGIAIVTIAIHISMAKMLARKKNYEIDESQVSQLLLGDENRKVNQKMNPIGKKALMVYKEPKKRRNY